MIGRTAIRRRSQVLLKVRRESEPHHSAEDAALVLEELERGAKLDNLAKVHYADPVVRQDGKEPVGNREERLVGKLGPDRFLDLGIRLEVDAGGALVENDDLRKEVS